jgi:hypothetical protein
MMDQPPFTQAVWVAGGAAIVFFCVTFFTQWHHEMWRDELQAWRLAGNSASISDLIAHLKYEGHPAVWYLCLYVLGRFSDDPFLMQAFHLAMATSTIYLFARFSPFRKHQKILFASGYLMIYEYAVLSRSYVLGVFGLFLYCVDYRLRPGDGRSL